jgi:hypothetical protein
LFWWFFDWLLKFGLINIEENPQKCQLLNLGQCKRLFFPLYRFGHTQSFWTFYVPFDINNTYKCYYYTIANWYYFLFHLKLITFLICKFCNGAWFLVFLGPFSPFLSHFCLKLTFNAKSTLYSFGKFISNVTFQKNWAKF